MEQLPTEILDKIIFPKHYKPNNQISNLNQKLIIGHNFNKLEMVNNQIKSIHKEYIYKTGESDSETMSNNYLAMYYMLKNISFPRYILMKNLSKKNNKSIKNNINLCNKIVQFYTNTTSNVCYYNSTNINNNLLTTNNFIGNYINTNISYN